MNSIGKLWNHHADNNNNKKEKQNEIKLKRANKDLNEGNYMISSAVKKERKKGLGRFGKRRRPP